jgi:NAD(P)-dependent dehydrogenase (short-subunit alcohol dehydrogenase family)
VDGEWVRGNADASDDPERFLASMRRRQPTGALISPKAVARAITWLADSDVRLTGVDLPVDGGLTAIHRQ